MLRRPLVAGALLGLFCCTHGAWADTWDLNLSRLCKLQLDNGSTRDCGGGYTPALGGVTGVIPDNAAFRSLMSEMGVLFAPNILSPADTQGFSGFNMSVEFGFTGVNPKKVSNDPNGINHWFWRAAESVSPKAFEDGDISGDSHTARTNRDIIANELPSSIAPTVTVMARKGLWLPVPSFELAAGIKHLIHSRMWAPIVMAKISVHEGFQGWPLPAFAVRGSGVRVVGSPDFNLSIAGIDFSISKHIGIASTWNLTPYVGYQLLWIVADSEVLDATPAVDAMDQTIKNAQGDPFQYNRCMVSDCNGNFTFADQANITRHRVFFGARINFYIASLLVEYSLFASGGKSDEVFEKATKTKIEIPDDSGTQHNVSFSIELDF